MRYRVAHRRAAAQSGLTQVLGLMPKNFALAAVFFAASASLASEPPRIQFGALGALHTGMSESAVARAARSPVEHMYPGSEENGCFYGTVAGLPSGASLMFLDGRLARIDVTEGALRTVSGAGIDSSEQMLKRLYGKRLVETTHAYDGPVGHYLTLMSSDRSLGIRFETDGDKVTTYYSGTAEAIRLKEGCQ